MNRAVFGNGAVLEDREETTALDLAWRVHDRAAGAIDKADTKAGFAATLETAAAAAVLTLARQADGPQGGAGRMLLWAGALLMTAIILAVAVVAPILRSPQVDPGEPAIGHLLYFGALRRCDPWSAASQLDDRADAVYEICRQSVVLSKLAWFKHRLLQLSLLSATLGFAVAGASVFVGGAR